MVDHSAGESKPGCFSHLKNSLSIAIARGRQLGALPENCHLLPSTAILGPQNRYACFNCSISSLPFEGMPASMGAGLRTVSGAVGSLGAKLSPKASLSDDRRIRQQSEDVSLVCW
jgi:hypothetical protein